MSFYQKQKLISVVCDTFMTVFRFSWTHPLPRPQLFAQPQPPQRKTDSMRAHESQLPNADRLQAQSFSFFLPLMDLGEIPYYKVWLPIVWSCPWAFMMQLEMQENESRRETMGIRS